MPLARRTFLAGLPLAGELAACAAPPFAASPPGAPSPSPPPRAAHAAALCATCGTQFAAHAALPTACPICEDERQYVGEGGQRWSTLDELRRGHRNVFTPLEPGVTALRTEPTFAIGQRAFFVEAEGGNALWECVSLVDDATVEWVRARGGVQAIAVSHPHFYASMVEWSHALGGVPVWVHELDRRWVMRPDPVVRFWSGRTHALGAGLTLVHVGGHFEGSQALVWSAGAGGEGALFAGDEPNVCADRRWVTFMRSYPNYIPLSAEGATKVAAALRPWRFDRLYGWAPGRTIERGAKRAVEASLERHLRALRGEHGAVGTPA